MNYRCKCGSDQFVRHWGGVSVHTPCAIDMDREIIRMDFSCEEQNDGRGSYREFYCAECGRPLESELGRCVLREFEYASTNEPVRSTGGRRMPAMWDDVASRSGA